MDGTFEKEKPLRFRPLVERKISSLMIFVFSATDPFPLSVHKLIIEKLFNKEAAHAWIEFGSFLPLLDQNSSHSL